MRSRIGVLIFIFAHCGGGAAGPARKRTGCNRVTIRNCGA